MPNTMRKSNSLKMRAWAKSLFLIPALVALQAGAQTYTTYNTFGEPGNIYDGGDAWLVNGGNDPPEPYVGEAVAFTPTVSGYLDQLSIAMSGGTAASALANVFIEPNSSQNLPTGTYLQSFLYVSTTADNNGILTLTSTKNPFLQAGDPYWLCVVPASGTTDIAVNQNSQGVQAVVAQSFSLGSWGKLGSNNTFAFDVEVEETVVPEPSTAALAALGISVLSSPLSRRFYFNSRQPRKTKA